MQYAQPAWRVREAPKLCDWMFVEASRALPELDTSQTLGALVLPFAPPLWVGEERTVRCGSEEHAVLARAHLQQAPLARITGASSCVGSTATIARVLSVGSDGTARLAGVGRGRVVGMAASRPALQVRAVPMCDKPLLDDARAEAASLSQAVSALWAQAVEVRREMQELQLQAKLRKLGGGASAMLLAVPLEDQLSLSKLSTPSPSGDAALRSSAVDTCEEALASGSLLEEFLQAALAARSAADVASVADADDDDLSLLSFVALRLSGMDDEQHTWAHGSTDCCARLAAAVDNLERKVAELQTARAILE